MRGVGDAVRLNKMILQAFSTLRLRAVVRHLFVEIGIFCLKALTPYTGNRYPELEEIERCYISD